MGKPVIAIDGPAGSGKSSTSLAVSQELGFGHLDSGGLYRAATLAALDEQIPMRGGAVVHLAKLKVIELRWLDGRFQPFISGASVETLVRSPLVTSSVSTVAAMPEVREWVNREVRGAAETHPKGVVVDGRDIGTVVFPRAQVKIFLTADPDARAGRRARQMGIDSSEEIKAITQEIMVRDLADMERPNDPLSRAPDAMDIDTTDLDFDDQVAAIANVARRVFNLD
jgi:cytidylate kinase